MKAGFFVFANFLIFIANNAKILHPHSLLEVKIQSSNNQPVTSITPIKAT